MERTRKPCLAALSDANLKASDLDEIILVGGSTRIPAVQAMVKGLFSKEPTKNVNPDEVVALGAAVQGGDAGRRCGRCGAPRRDAPIPGHRDPGRRDDQAHRAQHHDPHSKKEIFSTAADSQPAVDIHVLQGEREMAVDNRTLGRFKLDGIPPAPRGVPQVEVTFDIDANGILNVSAKDLGTGKAQSIKIESSSGLSKEEVEKMAKEAESHADEDKKKREIIDVRNQADHLAYLTEKTLKEHGSKVSDEERKKIEDARDALKKAMEGEDVEAIKKGMEDLSQASYKLSEIIYQEAAQSQQAQQGGAEAQPEGDQDKGDDVIDAEFEVKE